VQSDQGCRPVSHALEITHRLDGKRQL
jgi:hypothetical protein